VVDHESTSHALDDPFLVTASILPEVDKGASVWDGKIVTSAALSTRGDLQEVDLPLMTSLRISFSERSLSDLPSKPSTLMVSLPEIDLVAPP